MRRNRVFRDRKNPLDMYYDVELYDKFRFRRHDIITIVDELLADLEYPDRHATRLLAGYSASHSGIVVCEFVYKTWWLRPSVSTIVSLNRLSVGCGTTPMRVEGLESAATSRSLGNRGYIDHSIASRTILRMTNALFARMHELVRPFKTVLFTLCRCVCVRYGILRFKKNICVLAQFKHAESK